MGSAQFLQLRRSICNQAIDMSIGPQFAIAAFSVPRPTAATL